MISAACGASGLSLVVWYLAQGQLGQVDSSPECEIPIKKVAGVWALDWLVWYLTSALPGQVVYYQWADPGRGSPSRISKVPHVKASEYRK